MSRHALNARYVRLTTRFPLKPITSDAEYRRAAVVVDELAVRDEDDLDRGERKYLDALARLLDAYDGRMKFLVK